MELIIVTLIITLITLIKLYFKLSAGRCKSPVCLLNKTALITGGNSGIGYQTALTLASRGCRVILADKDNCEKSKERIIKETGNSNIVTKCFDLASLHSIRKLAENINTTEARLDILINNAGICGPADATTDDGLNMVMQVNYFGPFLLTHLLNDLLKKSSPSRIIFVSSCVAFMANLSTKSQNAADEIATKDFWTTSPYMHSKLFNIIMANEFARRLRGTGVTCNSLHPGVVYTPLYQQFTYRVVNFKMPEPIMYIMLQMGKHLFKTEEEGAQTTIHLALAKELENVTGKFFIDCRPFRIPTVAKDRSFAERIWKISEYYVKLGEQEKIVL